MMLSIVACACWPSVYLLWRRVCPGPLPIWESGCFLLLSCRNASYSLDIRSLSDTRFAGIFTHSMGVAFSLCLLCPLMYGSLFTLTGPVYFMLLLPSLLLVSQPRNCCQIWHFSAMFSLRNSVVFALVFRPLIHFELIFVHGTGEGLTSFFSMWTSSFLKSICRTLPPPPPLNGLGIFVKIVSYVLIDVKVYFWALCSSPLVFMLVPQNVLVFLLP